MCTQEDGGSQDAKKKIKSWPHHKLNRVEEALVELGVLELVLWVVGAVHHPARAAGRRSKLLLARILHAPLTFWNACGGGEEWTRQWLVSTSTYDDKLVVVLSVLPSTSESLFGGRWGLRWRCRARGGAAGQRGLQGSSQPSRHQKREKKKMEQGWFNTRWSPTEVVSILKVAKQTVDQNHCTQNSWHNGINTVDEHKGAPGHTSHPQAGKPFIYLFF